VIKNELVYLRSLRELRRLSLAPIERVMAKEQVRAVGAKVEEARVNVHLVVDKVETIAALVGAMAAHLARVSQDSVIQDNVTVRLAAAGLVMVATATPETEVAGLATTATEVAADVDEAKADLVGLKSRWPTPKKFDK